MQRTEAVEAIESYQASCVAIFPYPRETHSPYYCPEANVDGSVMHSDFSSAGWTAPIDANALLRAKTGPKTSSEVL